MKNVLYGALCGALVFGALNWVTGRKEVHGAVLTAPPEGRFQLVQLHPSAASEWSGILDTETGCTWLFAANNPDDPTITDKDYKLYLQVLGRHAFETVHYDPSDYISPQLSPVKTNYGSYTRTDYAPLRKAIWDEGADCSQARQLALKAASAR